MSMLCNRCFNDGIYSDDLGRVAAMGSSSLGAKRMGGESGSGPATARIHSCNGVTGIRAISSTSSWEHDHQLVCVYVVPTDDIPIEWDNSFASTLFIALQLFDLLTKFRIEVPTESEFSQGRSLHTGESGNRLVCSSSDDS